MDQTTLVHMHYSGILNGEIVAIGALAVIIIGMLCYREDRKSSKWLAVSVLLEIMHLIGDAGTFEYSLYLNLPISIAVVFYFMAYSFGSITTIAFAMYVRSYIEERTRINKWIFRVPVILEMITFGIITAAIASGDVYRIADGKVTAIGSIPVIATIIPMIVIIYIPIAALTKVKTIGWKAVFLLGLFGIVPGVTMFISYDHSVITAAFALLIVYILLQCDTSAEKEKKRSELAELNAHLEENQAQLEETAAEQEAQIEEIRDLNHSLAEYNNTMANAGYGMWHIILKDGVAPRMQVNDKMAELLGIAGQDLSEEELYNAWYDQIVPDAIPSVQASVNEMMAGNFSENTYRWIHPVKGMIYVRCGGTAVTLEDGTNVLSGYHADVTDIVNEDEQKKEELNRIVSRLNENQEIVRAAGFGIWKFSITSEGRICGMSGNDKLRDIYGYENEHSTPEEFLDYFLNGIENEEDDLTRFDYSAIEAGKIFRSTFAWRHPRKGTIYVESSGIKYVDPEGNAMLFGSSADVTETVNEENKKRRELKEAKEAAEKRSEELRDQLDIIGGLSNACLVVYAVNKETKKFFAIKEQDEVHELLKGCRTADEAFEKFLPVGVDPKDLLAMKEFTALDTLPDRLKDKDTVSIEFRKKFPVEGWNRASWIVVKRDDTGNTNKFLYIVEEITDSVRERKQQEDDLKQARDQAEAANAAKTSFLFNMSHDIRTPMNAIIGFRDLLEKHQEEPEKRRDYLNKIRDASTVLLSIINNVLEMARIEKGTLEIDETAWSTEQFNDTLYSVFHVMMEGKGLNFTRQIEVQHHYVYCDPTKLREIFINILSNAYKYTNAGGSVNMRLEEIPFDREGWVLYRTTISDTGIGMSEEFLPHLFEEFAREQNTTDAKVEGTGLGMPIVKRLVEMLDGTIEVKSRKGEGSTFIISIPHRIAEKSTLARCAGVEIDPKLFKDKHILLAEDNDLNAEIATEILNEAGFIVERAEDGVICVDKLRSAHDDYYDLILMDIQMPNMNGYEATRTIRQLEDSHRSNIKIIAMTANAFEEDKREALRAGMNGHIAKPINVNDLMKTLASVVG